MQKSCLKCAQQFEITDEDLKFYDKVSPVFAGKKYSFPVPTICPDCRLQRRLVLRNERRLYHRKCDFSGEEIISLYSGDKPYKVYKEEIWRGDKWNPLEYGKDYLNGGKFFPQFRELQLDVPRRCMQQDGTNENCTYITFGKNNKNCYMAFACFNSENLYYSANCGSLKDGSDCLFCVCTGQELLYECIYCQSCYNCSYCTDCRQCTDSILLDNCHNCRNCIACKNLRNKDYHIYNKPVAKEEYEKFKRKLQAGSLLKEKRKFYEWKLQLPNPHMHAVNTVECDGDYLDGTKNCHSCYDVLMGGEDCSYVSFSGWNAKDMMDSINAGMGSELIYESNAIVSSHRITHSFFIRNSNDIYYCENMIGCSDCIGCIGLTHKQYCILNRQYTKKEYQEKAAEIAENMQNNGEWGELFPITNSLFAYNETAAMDYYPLTKEQCLNEGFQWKEEGVKSHFSGQKIDLPLNISEVSDDISKQILFCQKCGQNYRIIMQELNIYRKMGISLPSNCFECRHRERMKLHNPRKLWDRKCAKCSADIKTSYAPDRPEIVYCEGCYLKEIY